MGVPGERMMFLGATDQPWAGDMGMLNQVFTRFIRVPKLFYGSRRLLLKHFITVLGGDIEETELAALTLMANNYTVNDIKNVCRRVVTPQRPTWQTDQGRRGRHSAFATGTSRRGARGELGQVFGEDAHGQANDQVVSYR